MMLVEISKRTSIATLNLSLLKNEHAKAIKSTTLDAIREVLECEPADLIARET